MKSIRLLILFYFVINCINAQSIVAGQHTTSDFYFDANPDTLLAGIYNHPAIPNYPLDINNDGIIDFYLGVQRFGSPSASLNYCRIIPTNDNQISFSYIDSCLDENLSFVSANLMAKPYYFNDSIDANAEWKPWTLDMSYQDHEGWAPRHDCVVMTFDTVAAKYLGVRVFTATDTLYGWIKVKVIDTFVLYFEEFACNTGAVFINESENPVVVRIGPNPVTDIFNVYLNNTFPSKIFLYDISSRKLLSQNFTESVSLNTDQFADGIYIFEVRNKNGIISKGKIIKQ
jgi:hypothetical protein